MSARDDVQTVPSTAPFGASNLDLAVFGVGCRTAVGLTAPSTSAAVRAGIAGFRQHPYIVDRHGDPLIAAALPAMPGATSIEDRLLVHAVAAARETLETASLCVDTRAETVHLALALPEPRPGIPDEMSRNLPARLQDALRPYASFESVSIFPAGHAAGVLALAWCGQQLASRPSGLCLLGGIDSYLDAESIDWLESEELLKHKTNPWGFIPGEAAAFVLIGKAGNIRVTAEPAVRIESFGVATELHVRRSDNVCVGQGLSDAARLALRQQHRKADYVICDLNGEPYRADEFAFTTVRITQSFAAGVVFETPSDAVGDIGAASALLFIALAERRPRHAPAAQNVLLTTSSEAGTRAAALVRTA